VFTARYEINFYT